MLEELLVAPAFNRLGRDARGVFLGERPASDRHRLLGEVGDLCVLNDLRRPVKQMPLAANRVELADGEVGEVLAGAGVPVPLPGDWHALRGSGDLEHHDAPFRMVHHSDASKRHAGIGAVVDLPFETVKAIRVCPVARADDFPRLVPHPEHEPRRRLVGEVRFVAQCRDVATYLVGVEIVARLLELDGLVFPVPNKGLQQHKVALVGRRFRHASLQGLGDQPPPNMAVFIGSAFGKCLASWFQVRLLVVFYQHQSAPPLCRLQKMTDKTGREQRFHYHEGIGAPRARRRAPRARPADGPISATARGLANRCIGRLVSRFMEDANQPSARETRRIWSLPENLLPLFGCLGYNPKPDAGVAKW